PGLRLQAPLSVHAGSSCDRPPRCTLAAPRSARAVHRIFCPDVDFGCVHGVGWRRSLSRSRQRPERPGSVISQNRHHIARELLGSPFRVTPTFTVLRLLVLGGGQGVRIAYHHGSEPQNTGAKTSCGGGKTHRG